MADRSLRVALVATGGVGAIAGVAILDEPHLDLVAAWAHSSDKVGRDIGEVLGRAPVGLTLTGDLDEVIAAQPDCVAYCASGEARPRETVADIARLLRAGVNVVTTSVPGLLFPEGYDAESVALLRAACTEGSSTLYASGIEPGFAADHLVLTLATMSRRITTIRTQEHFTYTDYPVAFTMFDVFGFGKPPEHTCLMELPGVQRSAWGPPVEFVAHHLGVELGEIRETYDKRVTERRLDVAAGVIEAGTVGAVRFETIGVVDGRDAIVIEHVNRMALDLAPDWPTADRDGTYRIEIEGDPALTCTLNVGHPSTFTAEGMVATTMRIVNAIPFVCAAPTGIATAHDLPLTLPRAAFRP